MDLIYKEEAYKIIGACMEVHNELGNGFLEAVYHEALMYELNNRSIPFQNNVKLQVSYKGYFLSKYYFADMVCYDKRIVHTN
ncbi:MAG: GxxExxY protein [Bacteroidota bacterium]|nr:GxxExxY protein [Bacteroidota bacterium]